MSEETSDDKAAPDRGEPIVEVRDVVKTFPGGKTVLKGINLEIYAGETFLIMGGSGCGKSTLLNCIIGVEAPTSGSVRVLGQDIHALRGKALKELQMQFGMLFQSGALLQSLTIAENVAIPLEQHYPELGDDIIMETARMKLRAVDLEEHAEKYPSEISGGMKKRAGLARALALDPKIFFSDEPTAGLDPISVYSIDMLTTQLTKKINATAVVVTHDINSFLRIADRAIILGGDRDGDLQGTALMTGTVAEFQKVDHPLIQRFINNGEEPQQP